MMEQSAQNYFSPENRVAPLGIVAMNGAEELSDKIEAHLVRWGPPGGHGGGLLPHWLQLPPVLLRRRQGHSRELGAGL